MSDIGGKVGTFTPAKTMGLFGNPVLGVNVHQNGIEVTRKKGAEQYLYSAIQKITAKNYASPAPAFIYISIGVENAAKTIDFALHPNKKDVNLLLGVFSDFQLGPRFPSNLNELTMELGGLGTPLWLQNGHFIAGDTQLAAGDLEEFSTDKDGFYNLKFRDMAHKLAVSPDCAPNILSSIKILSVIEAKNHGAF